MRQIHPVCDLRVRQTFDLTEKENLLVRGTQRTDGVPQLVELRTLLFRDRVDELVLKLHLVRPARECPVAPPRGVLCDAEEPGARLLGCMAAPESPIGVEKRTLGDLLRVGSVPDIAKDEAVHLGKVPPVEPLERTVVETPPQGFNPGAHWQ
jgi:hypothetical protein